MKSKMGRKSLSVNKVLEINKKIIDENLYPRDSWNFQTSYGYSQAMLAGAKFPAITVAMLYGKQYLVDGRHRIEALKILKKTKIDAEVIVGWSKQRIFEEAIKRNVSHGRALTVHEKRVAALKLRNWDYPPDKISALIQVPLDKLENFVAQRLVNAITGETIAEGGRVIESHVVPMIVKSGIKNTVGSSGLSMEMLEETQHGIYSGTQRSLLIQLISIVKAGLLDTTNKEINKLVKELIGLLTVESEIESEIDSE
jgi:hypothetical protein